MLGKERDKAVSLMTSGLVKKVVELYEAGRMDGIVSIAGLTGMIMALDAMKALSFGLPKLIVSSAAAMPAYASKFAEYYSLRDITVMHTVTDTTGFNPLVERLTINVASAIGGWLKGTPLCLW